MSKQNVSGEDEKELDELKKQLHEIYRKINIIESRKIVDCPHCNGSGKINKTPDWYDYPYPQYPSLERFNHRKLAEWRKD
tara:strand:+ start:5578 stop:5817 length:240 start_codon:yes stop_codon:yes gene_type:complete